jgi:GDP-L-fucose synthase
MVGKAVLKRLQSENCEILSAPHTILDLTQKQKTFDWLNDKKPDVIIVAAAKVGGIGANIAEPEAFYDVNLAIAQNVIEGAYHAGASKLLYLGSSCIYPRNAEQPIKEAAFLTGKLEPTNEYYARAKIEGIRLCQKYRVEHGCDFISAMPTNLYGPHDNFDPDKSHVIPALIHKIHQAKIKKESTVTLWGTGTPLREFLYVDDLADALIYVLKNYSAETPMNIGSGEEIPIHDLAFMISKIIGYEGGIQFNPDMPDGTPRKLLDSSKIKSLGWSVRTTLKDGLQKTYQWYLDNF